MSVKDINMKLVFVNIGVFILSLQINYQSCSANGNLRSRLPVAAKIALPKAAATGGKAGSPNPVGASSDSHKFYFNV